MWGELPATAEISKNTARLVKYRAERDMWGELPATAEISKNTARLVKYRAERDMWGELLGTAEISKKNRAPFPHQISGMSIRGSRDIHQVCMNPREIDFKPQSEA
jgi:hypothetical protein